MKYANICYKWKNDEFNLGDDIQLLAIDYLYTLMGIKTDEVIKIPYYELHTYVGEEVILPICFPFHNYSKDDVFFDFSSSITPVFLNLSISGMYLNEKDINYLKRYEPIGCRDLNTLRVLKKEGIKVYANGCITQIFPQRNLNKAYNAIFCVDIDDDLLPYIPEKLKTDLVTRTHALKYSQNQEESRTLAISQLKEYESKAKLVVTSRLHCALPCIAMGIPTVLANRKRSHRFEGVDRIVNFYNKIEYADIVWYPQEIKYDSLKTNIIELNIKRLKGEEITAEEVEKVSEVFCSSLDKVYSVDYLTETIRFIDELMKSKDGIMQYYLWGITPIAYTIYRYIKEMYPQSVLIGVIDKTKKIPFCNCVSGVKEDVIKEKNAWVFVCTRNAIYESKQFFQLFGMQNIYQCCGDEYEY